MKTVRKKQKRKDGGFTLVELLIVIALVGLLSTFGFPLLQNYINRAKVDGSMRSTMVLFRQARYEAIKKSRTITVQADLTNNWIDSYWDENGDRIKNNNDVEVAPRFRLRSGVTFKKPVSAPGVQNPGFFTDGGSVYVFFQNDGSVTTAGAIRVGDTRENYLEIEVSPAATAKASLRKWIETGGGRWLEWGREEESWKWY